jgi:hypothetical protein
MMAERQVVIVKEAQDLSRTIDKLKVMLKTHADYCVGHLL